MNDPNENTSSKELEEKLIWFAELRKKVDEYHYFVALSKRSEKLYDPEGVEHSLSTLGRELLFHLPKRFRAKYTL